ncbi:adenylyl-sulfate kinase [Burkholderia alba]|uniref:adenylyl-sulfate kinase n=1 Tax=Burkholderia alba TaxID=2683677 RepID=UPI002B058863|nr:adenylyl-sulfate kinase [Burkholderia alba]
MAIQRVAGWRDAVAGSGGGVLWLTGLPGAGKSTLADALADVLNRDATRAVVLDGDRLRATLSRDLGFSDRDRRENVRRTAEMATMIAETGLLAIVALISPTAAMRGLAREIAGGYFREVYVKASGEVCEARDPKGLYKRARRGELPDFTGVSAPYETPSSAQLMVDTEHHTIEQCVDRLTRYAAQQFGAREAVPALRRRA